MRKRWRRHREWYWGAVVTQWISMGEFCTYLEVRYHFGFFSLQLLLVKEGYYD